MCGLAVFAGYYDDPDADARAFRNGWFGTGDLGHMDAQGFLFITGRSSDKYISGGSKVYPREVGEKMLVHPAIAEVSIVGVPDLRWGEAGVAVCVLRPGASLSEPELLARMDGKVARYKLPTRVFFWDELPKSGYGKVTKKIVREELEVRDCLAGSDDAPPRLSPLRCIGRADEPDGRCGMAQETKGHDGYDSRADTLAHIHRVRDHIGVFVSEMLARGRVHDASKLTEPEKSAFDWILPRLRGIAYGSPDYQALVIGMGPALDHHYQANSHHPEHYGSAGIAGMDLFDLVEMLCDWIAAAERNPGDGVRLDYNATEFGLEPQLVSIIANTLARWPVSTPT